MARARPHLAVTHLRTAGLAQNDWPLLGDRHAAVLRFTLWAGARRTKMARPDHTARWAVPDRWMGVAGLFVREE